MKKTLKIALLFSIVISCKNLVYSQTFEDKLNLYFASGITNTIGNKDVNENNYITPSLYANYEKGNHFVCKSTYQLLSFLSVGLQYRNTKLSNWNHEDNYKLYVNSNSKINTIAAVFQFHTKFQMQGFYNRVKLFAEIKPLVGQSTLELANPVFEVVPYNSSSINIPTTSSSKTAGVESSIGFDYAFSRWIGFFSNFNFDFQLVKSQYYNDKNIINTSIDFGFFVRLIKNKHYY